jgi:hypothetical protein
VEHQISCLLDERELLRKRELQRAVLQYLAEVGPVKWDVLCSQLDQKGSREIRSELGHLVRWKHITIEGDIARITSSGVNRLKYG